MDHKDHYILSDVLSSFIDRTGNNITWIANKSGVNHEVVRRTINRLSKPVPDNARRMLESTDIAIDEINNIMRDCYSKEHLPKKHRVNFKSDPQAMYDYSLNIDRLMMFGLTSKSNGIEREKIYEHVAKNDADNLLKEFKEKEMIHEKEGKYKSTEIAAGGPTSLNVVSAISKLADKNRDNHGHVDISSNTFVEGLNEEYYEKYQKMRQKFKEKLFKEIIDNPDARGDKVIFYASVDLTIKD